MSLVSEFIPKSWHCWREGYTRDLFLKDLIAGASVGVIALPLALAFAIASGVEPEKGLFTAIVAGFLISLLGGSQVQVSGPTGAFVVIVYGVIQKHGYEGLALATLLAAGLLVIMGLLRCGKLLKYIPHSVITGFTAGIALVIATSQLKDFFGWQADKIPPGFIEKCQTYCQIAHTLNGWALLLSGSTLLLVFLLRRTYPRWPGVMIAILLATLSALLFEIPVETIESKFGAIPRVLPSPVLPTFSWELLQRVWPDAIAIALLGAIESLLSAVVGDRLAGTQHRSNIELIAQGIGNLGSILFGGIPATGAIARTTANVKMGGKTPMAGMVHAATLLFLMVALAPMAGKIPLAALAGVLLFVAWNMSDLPEVSKVLQGHKSDAFVLLVTFVLTVLVDLIVAVQVGVLLAAAIFQLQKKGILTRQRL